MRKLCFPTLREVRLNNFSLYTIQDKIDVKFKAGITCLAGANGLGKSTFLQLVIYGLTGVVPKPGQKFVAVDEYYRDIRTFTREYFEGRIKPEHAKSATIELDLILEGTVITLTRGFVESGMLRKLTITENGKTQHFNEENGEKRQAAYQRIIVQRSGLGSFNEFVFLLSYVLTFDERRVLLFWDPKVLETCLLVFMGGKPKQRSDVEKLRREHERLSSRVRNLVYDIKQAKDRLDVIAGALKGSESKRDRAKTREEYLLLAERVDTARTEQQRIDEMIRDAKLAMADSASRSVALRSEYQAEFEARLKAKRVTEHHPMIKEALIEGKCPVCGAIGGHVTAAVKAELAAHHCPLCESTVSVQKDDPKMLARLTALDAALVREKRLIDSQSQKVTQLDERKAISGKELAALERELKDFEKENADVVASAGTNAKDFPAVESVFIQQIEGLKKVLKTEKVAADQARHDYRKAQKALEQQYLTARDSFVPLFGKLAHLFLGVDMNISLARDQSLTLLLDVKNVKRRSDHQLSESQRFFIDVALRMAFLQFASSNGGAAPLFLDTPEGSLDLAYEARAGEMVAKFCDEGHQVFMTANVNTSELLSSLAQHAGKCGFAVERMYEWTEMSKVQQEQQRRFDQTLDQLEKSIKKGKA